jgi:hypothetical protein
VRDFGKFSGKLLKVGEIKFLQKLSMKKMATDEHRGTRIEEGFCETNLVGLNFQKRVRVRGWGGSGNQLVIMIELDAWQFLRS